MQGAVWDKFVIGAPRLRMPSEQQYSDRKLRSRRLFSGCSPSILLQIRALSARSESMRDSHWWLVLIHGAGWFWFTVLAGWRPAWTGKPLSMYLRSRALAAVDEGVSCRAPLRASGLRPRRWSTGTSSGAARVATRRTRRAVIRGRGGSRRIETRCWRCTQQGATSRWRNCAESWARRVWRWQSRRCTAFCPTRHHAQKKTGHAVEQDRADVLTAREDWFGG